jgi:hypothetical protein
LLSNGDKIDPCGVGQLEQRVHRAVNEVYNSRRNPARSSRRAGVSSGRAAPGCATLHIAATAFVFELCGRNPKRIKRWLYLVLPTRRSTCKTVLSRRRQVNVELR